MRRRRACIAVDIDLDPVPGFGHDAESMAAGIRRLVNDALGNYDPEVTVIDPGQVTPMTRAHRDLDAPLDPSALRLAGRCAWSWLSHPLIYGLGLFYGSVLLGLWGGRFL